jgi:L-lactate dehydrogenase complex protein LldG
VSSEARDEILSRIRAALAGAPHRTETPVPRDYARARPREDIVAHFVERVADYRAEVQR